jgi:tripeptide aminopeptidase|tara:strand:+ start:42575 stop:43402 length:828 start_codon:yes stop_codon:yes gene_type:complete
MNKEFLKEILSIPTYSGQEQLVIKYLTNYAIENNVECTIDRFGNVYLYKGEMKEGEFRPCVVAHTDTVHVYHDELVSSNKRLVIKQEIDEIKDGEGYYEVTSLRAYDPINGEQTGIGGDDKAGIFIALQLFEKHEKIMAAFFVSEEVGCIGSRAADKENFKNVGWFIQFDAPTDNWVSKSCNGVELFDDNFQDNIMDILTKHGQTKISHDPYTDVFALRPKTGINCINIFAGYERLHTKSEYVVIENVQKSIDLAKDLIDHLGHSEYKYEGNDIY